MSSRKTLSLFAALLIALLPGGVAAATPDRTSDEGGDTPICFYVSSYHVGLQWSDNIEAALRTALDGHCRIESFHMDTKRRRDPAYMVAAGKAAHARMLEVRPDVVIASDDNAARHFIEPWLLGTDMPVVFTGINWTIEEYNLPAPNVTGMIEVAPLEPLLQLGVKLSGGGRRALYFAGDTVSSHKDLHRLRLAGRKLGMSIDSILVDSLVSWHDNWRRVQDQYDFIFVGHPGAFDGWDEESMRRFTLDNTRIPVLASATQAMPWAAVGLTRLPEELGEWAGASAVAILDGLPPSDIPLVTNRRWEAWINEPMVERIGLDIDKTFVRTAKRVR